MIRNITLLVNTSEEHFGINQEFPANGDEGCDDGNDIDDDDCRNDCSTCGDLIVDEAAGETCDPPGSENCYGNSTIGTTPRFFGVIDTDGFERFEYREMEGKLEIDGGDIKYIYSDDFYFVLGDSGLVFKNGFE